MNKEDVGKIQQGKVEDQSDMPYLQPKPMHV